MTFYFSVCPHHIPIPFLVPAPINTSYYFLIFPATTAELITDVLSQAQEVRTGGTSGPEFYNGENGIWMRLGAVPYQEADGTQEENTNKAGICKVFIADNGQETRVPLLSDGAMAKRFYTDFNVDQYSYEDGCFTVKDINVYYKADAKRSDKVPGIKHQ